MSNEANRARESGEFKAPPWDPFAGCSIHTVTSATTVPATRYWQEILAGAVAVANAYGMIKGAAGNGNDAQFAAIQTALADIRRAIDQVNDNLVRIMMILSDLPMRIRGEVNNALFNQSMGAAQAVAGDVSDFSHPGAVDTHQAELSNCLVLLNRDLGAIKGVKGLSGVFLTGPLLSTWLCGAVALERSLMRTKPGYTPMTPWARTAMVTAGEDLKKFAEDMRDLETHYTTEAIPKFPKHKKVLAKVIESDGTVFLRTRRQNELGDRTDYMLKCPTSAGGLEALQQSLIIPGQWQDATDPLANELLGRIKTRRTEILSFFDFLPKFQAVEAAMLGSFTEPTNIWLP